MLQGTQAGFKNELLFSQFGINYNKLPERFKKVGRQIAGRSTGLPISLELSARVCVGFSTLEEPAAALPPRCRAPP